MERFNIASLDTAPSANLPDETKTPIQRSSGFSALTIGVIVAIGRMVDAVDN